MAIDCKSIGLKINVGSNPTLPKILFEKIVE